MHQSYWSRVLDQRLQRRRALAVTSGTALGAALLAACGGGDSSGGGNGDSSSLVTKPVDTSKEAKRGGVMRDRVAADTSTLDPIGPVAPLNPPARHAYSTLVRQKAGFQEPATSELSPDVAESWEYSPDRLTITLKLRQGVKFHNKPPVNGRTLDADDVVASWNRWKANAPLRALASNEASPQAPVLSVTATDSRTISIKLKEPLVYALELFASFGSFTGNIVMVPKEADNGLDLRRDMVGTGPYFLSNYQPSIGFTLKRHEEYWDQSANFIEQIEQPIVPEYAAVISQLKAGNIHYLQAGLRSEDVLTLKRDDPRFNIYAIDLETANTVMTFGQLPDGRSPFLDERVRQAFSMSWDRDAWIDAFFNVSTFEAEGIPVGARWNSALPNDYTGWWLDPQGNDFGPNAKYYQYSIDEAKKLMSAAGLANGVDVKSNRITGVQVADLARFAEALEGMAQEAGFRFSIVAEDYATEYIPKIRDGNGQYEGVGFHTVTGTTPWRLNPVSALAAEYWSKAGTTFKGFSTSGKNDKSGDPAIDSMIEKARLEPDVEKRKTLVNDLQKALGKSLYGLINPGSATRWAVAWPAVQNYYVYHGPAAWTHYGVWLDQTKPPFAGA
jgi:peptide/nickel transport system substrate-binding protein